MVEAPRDQRDGEARVRNRLIARVIDARATQGRLILHLECKHVVSISNWDYALLPPGQQLFLVPGAWFTCPNCETPTPIELQREKSATQLWKEAGEP